jgi:hypothetical protein
MMDQMTLQALLAQLKGGGMNPVPEGGSAAPLGDLSSMVPPGGAPPGPGPQNPFAAPPDAAQAQGLLAEAGGPMGPGMTDTGQAPVDISAPGPSNQFNMVSQPGGGGPMVGEGSNMQELLAKGLMGMNAGRPRNIAEANPGHTRNPYKTSTFEGKTHTTGGKGPDFAALIKMLRGK